MRNESLRSSSHWIFPALLAATTLAGCAQLDEESPDEWTDTEAEGTSTALETPDASEVVVAAYEDCGWGEICFYTGRDGTGDKCSWTSYDENWSEGSVQCSWAGSQNVCSVFNKTSVRFEYFRSANYINRIGSTGGWSGGNLACNYKLASHRRQ